MDVKTYRAKSMQEALRLVRRELGPNAAVLHTREVRSGLLRWVGGGKQIEVVAAKSVNVPSRLPLKSSTFEGGSESSHERKTPPARPRKPAAPAVSDTLELSHTKTPEFPRRNDIVAPIPAADMQDYREKFRGDLKGQIDQLSSLVEQLCRQQDEPKKNELPAALFQLFAELIDAEVSEELARQWTDHLRRTSSAEDLADLVVLKSRLARLIESEINTSGPIQVAAGERKLVALVGPTGVGKTTTIAKMAANFRLREHKRVGLVTVDTYRIAAVDQLRTYADIMDLPMEVVSTPRELRDALQRLSHLDLILMDTAGRSPRDEVQIQELKSMVAEAQPDEVHLVLSSVSSAAQMRNTAEKFQQVGVTSLLLTKLDEAGGLGNVIPVVRSSRLPLSYVTNGQNVPDDIEPADRRKLTRAILGF